MKSRAAKNTLAAKGAGRPVHRTPLRSDWMIISDSFTSELQGEITDNIDKGDEVTTFRRLSFGVGLFERTEIFFPGQVTRLSNVGGERESNLPI